MTDKAFGGARWLGLAPLALLAACGGLTDEERAAAMGGTVVPEAGAAERSAELARNADAQRQADAEAAELARIEKAKADEAKRQEALRLAAEQRAERDYPDGVELLVEDGDYGPRLVGEETRRERWERDAERRARAMEAREDRYARRYERERRWQEDRGDRYADQGDERAWRSDRREAEARYRDERRGDRDYRYGDEGDAGLMRQEM